MSVGTIRVALVGLEFGAEFVPIYLHHPQVERLLICDLNPQRLHEVGGRFDVVDRTTDLTAVLHSDAWDAVHLVTPVTLHAAQTLAVLESGKHCACTIPMGLELADLYRIVDTQARVGTTYMMMETAVYTREFLYAKALHEQGAFGPLTFLRGAHLQDMAGWPDYWRGFPPHKHITHALAPLLALTGTYAYKVHCFGSGELGEEFQRPYHNPFPLETAIFRLAGTNLAAEVTRFMFQTARSYTESFAVYGEQRSFEWAQLEEEDPLVFTMAPGTGRGSLVTAERVAVPDRAELLPPQIARFTQRGVYDSANPHLSFLQGGGHGGSHPHLVHEFVSSIIEKRPSAIDAVTAARWTAAGICAHASALRDGDGVTIPSFA